MANKTRKWTKSLGTVGKLISVIPDTTEIIGKAIDNTRPIIEKELERRQEYKQSFTQLDDVVHLPVAEARQHLESKGFVVACILATPHVKWASAKDHQVVKMSPKPSKVKIGSLIKLYYVTDTVITGSKQLLVEKQERQAQLQNKATDILKSPKNLFKKTQKTD
ncbi:PASTA domain-containing protein [Streptococcus sp. HF-1907]|uniref:PASTA domain-containing protein n=1 Tax=Streptococcus sp. HF-1907 TaxID=2785793 RepID=UPI00189FF601|nr:PASTA domain-containing protein [Streptococcus sp. HF-1907]MBF7093801.1 PASTA domain-containing protein [Streptococcus sp. HF-1907]